MDVANQAIMKPLNPDIVKLYEVDDPESGRLCLVLEYTWKATGSLRVAGLQVALGKPALRGGKQGNQG